MPGRVVSGKARAPDRFRSLLYRSAGILVQYPDERLRDETFERGTSGRCSFGASALQTAFYLRLIESHDNPSVDIDNGYAHLTGFPDHLLGSVLIFGYVVFGVRHFILAEIILGDIAVSATRRGVNGNGHDVLLYEFYIENNRCCGIVKYPFGEIMKRGRDLGERKRTKSVQVDFRRIVGFQPVPHFFELIFGGNAEF